MKFAVMLFRKVCCQDTYLRNSLANFRLQLHAIVAHSNNHSQEIVKVFCNPFDNAFYTRIGVARQTFPITGLGTIFESTLYLYDVSPDE